MFDVFLPGAASASDEEPPISDEDEEFPTNKEQPHLRFEITSDDGFSVEADSIEGRANISPKFSVEETKQ